VTPTIVVVFNYQ